MAIYIQIRKVEEDSRVVVYAFGPSEELIGNVQLNKETGEVTLLEIKGSRSDFYLPRVERTILRHFRIRRVSGQYVLRRLRKQAQRAEPTSAQGETKCCPG